MKKNIFKNLIFFTFAILGITLASCNKELQGDSDFVNGIKGIENPREGKEISFYGETITVSFQTNAAWDAEIVTEDGDSWATITKKTNQSDAGKGSVRLVFAKSKVQAKRVAKLYVTVSGYDKSLIAEFTQNFNDAAELSNYLNGEMHKVLLEEYLWRDDYKKLSDEGKLEMDCTYDAFLETNLVKLGDVNIEDGGYYRAYSSLYGQRYIYSYIQEITSVQSASTMASMPQTKASAKRDLGLGVTMASAFDQSGARCLIVGYVYQGSPAEKAGIQRGDLILEVNGNKLTQANYLEYQRELYYNPQGNYVITYGRYDAETGTKLIKKTVDVATATYPYIPVLFNGVWQNKDKSVNIGYLVLDSFDSTPESFDIMKQSLDELKKNEIKDLVLDLRFNPGGSVAMCRYLMSSIVGQANYDKTFSKMKFVDGREEVWSFGYGDKNQPDGLGQGPDLGLKNLYVICSENTGSASEIVINSLKGIDFPVVTIGSCTEGKNVGMTVRTFAQNGRRFEFAPINFWVRNAKDEGNYSNGIPADKMVNNQNSSYEDDKDPFFPYGTANWDIAYMGDLSVAWAYSLITTGKDLELKPKSASMMSPMTKGVTFTRLENVPFSPKMGHFGSLIYKNENN